MIHILPGMGADSTMFAGSWRTTDWGVDAASCRVGGESAAELLSETRQDAASTLQSNSAPSGIYPVNFIDWPTYTGERTIPEIAERVITENRIQNGDTVIGTSLGGIVGCEIANQLSLRHLVLIGSAKNASEINSLLALLHPLARMVPVEFLQWSAASLPGELTNMFTTADAAFLRATCAAIFTWTGLDETRIKPLRIHGRSDHVIPAPKDTDLLLDGGHLIAMTHAAECCEFLNSTIENLRLPLTNHA